MVFKKKGFPEEGELVLCTVKKVLYHSVFATLDEYENLEGLIHISEIAPGRIRNIRDYVIEGKRIVCKVLSVNKERNAIDLSLRRVSLQQRLKKEEEAKQEAKAEKILEVVAQKINIPLQELYSKIGERIIEEYGNISSCFNDIVANGENALKGMNLPENYAKVLVEVVRERIKPPKATVKGILNLACNASDGVERIKSAFKKGVEFAKQNSYDLHLAYMSAPNYLIEITASDYKTAENAIQKTAEAIISEIEKSGGEGSFKREE